MKRITLIPCYGRDYRSKRAVQDDFAANKDFEIADMSSPWDGKPTNQSTLAEEGYGKAIVYYHNKQKFAVLPITHNRTRLARQDS